MRRALLLLVATFFVCISIGFAESSDLGKGGSQSVARDDTIPQELSPWVEWVRARNPEWRCARTMGRFECVWPGSLQYTLTNSGGSFILDVEVLGEGLVPLPSSTSLFPRSISVTADGGSLVSAPLILEEGRLSLKLRPGRYQIRGSFVWNTLPPELPAPSSYGVVDVRLPADRGNVRARRGDNSLWLEERNVNPTTESLNLSVMRKITDGSPLRIETLVRLRVSGRSRPLQLPSILPPGALPVSVESPLPAMLSAEGALALQLLPGEYEIRILSLMQQPVATVTAPKISLQEWPAEEVWAWAPDMGFRSVEISGGKPLHADLTQLPPDWKGGAVYVVGSGGSVTLTETRRGEQSQAPNEIHLRRELWIDLDGSGLTASDRFQGKLSRDFRINAIPETKVGRATVNGQAALVTIDPKSGLQGVELREQGLDLNVISRLDNSRDFHGIGWDTTVDSLSLTLNLPPSWKLLSVAGATSASGAWVDTWSLLQIFVSILIVLAVYKLFSFSLAALVGVSLLFNHGEFLAPQMLYVHILLLAVWSQLAAGKSSVWSTLSAALLALSFGAWALQNLSFAKLQFTQALFPQLQAGTRYRTILQDLISVFEESLLAWPVLLAVCGVGLIALRSVITASSIGRGILKFIVYGIGFIVMVGIAGSVLGPLMRIGGGSRYAYNDGGEEYEGGYSDKRHVMNMVPQTLSAPPASRVGKAEAVASVNSSFSYEGKNLLSGPAVPSWRWRKHFIEVASPVAPTHQMRLYLLSPWINRALCAGRAALALLLVILLGRALGYSPNGVTKSSARGAGAVGAVVLAAILLIPGGVVAEVPSKEILDELQTRLGRTLCSRERCTVIEKASFSCTERQFKLSLVVSSEGISSVLVPGPVELLTPDSVRRNGRPTVGMRRSEGGLLEVRTENGQNLIELEGALPEAQSFSVQFGERPLVVDVQAAGWYVEGLSPSGMVGESLRFINRAPKEKGSTSVPDRKTEGLATWVVVQRSLTIGEQVAAHTKVTRLGSLSREAHVKIPLLPNEQVTSGPVSIENNELLIGFATGSEHAEFTSALPWTERLTVEVAPITGVSEEWIIECHPIVACDFSGARPVETTVQGRKVSRWLPFPGEQVVIGVKALAGIAGDFVTVDGFSHTVTWGANLVEGRVKSQLRATQQTSFKITPPEASSVTSVTLDGRAGQSSESAGSVSILLSPGAHTVELAYQIPWSPGLVEATPGVTVGSALNNVDIVVRPSADRWILWTGGISWGPCVVFWSKLILIILLCLALAKIGVLPASPIGAVLVGSGLATLPLILMVVPLAWLASLSLLPKLEGRYGGIPRWFRMVGFIGVSIVAISLWYSVVQTGLMFQPPMLIAGNGSTSSALKWYVDHVDGQLPNPWVVSVPLWIWRLVALAWSTWLVTALFGWLKRCVDIARSPFFQ